MSEKKSFWSSVPGLVTGLAGLLTGIVGLVTVLIQLHVIGGDSSKSKSTSTDAGVTTTVVVPTTTEMGSIAATPRALTFGPTDPKVKTVTVRNTGRSAPITVTQPTITGTDRSQFSVRLDDCSTPVQPNLSCTMEVTFVPAGALRSYNATLQIQPAGGVRGEEVSLSGSTLLGG